MDKTHKLVSGTIWSTVSSITTSVVHLLRLAILARILEKTDFGIVAMLTFVLGLTQTLSDLGFSSAIMHKRDISDSDFSSLYWIQFIVFFVFYGIAFLLRSPIAIFYNEPTLTHLLPIVLLDLLFQGIGKLYDVLAQKEFQFRILAIRNIVASLVSLTLSVVLAYSGFGVYSLIISSLAQTFILQIWNFIVGQKYIKLRFCLSFDRVFPLIKIGLFQMGTQILDYISAKIDILVLGRILGAEVLGIYNLAKELVLKVVAIVNSIANKVAMPFFSYIQDNDMLVGKNYCKMLTILSYINFPFCLIMGALSFGIVPILYGAEYVEMVPIVSILSVWGMTVCICNPVGNIVTAKGRTDLAFVYTIIRLSICLPITIIVSSYGIRALAIAQVVLALIQMLVAWYLELYKTIKLSLHDYLSSFFINGAITLCCLLLFSISLGNSPTGMWSLIFYSSLVLITYTAACLIFDRKHLRLVFDTFRQAVCRQ